MCGIVGIHRFDGAPVDPALLAAMTATLYHRGPDADGSWFSASRSTAFGHRRLSIIDLAGSPQPMQTPDGTLTACFNGEVFNYRELRAQLEFPWRTNGDTEVLLAGFRRHGPRFVQQLRGQYAYAIHDAGTNELWLFRDRLGVLPLHYYVDEEQLVFGSEIKAILPALPTGPRVDEESLSDYLAHRAVPTPNTLFQGVRKLRPGHWLRVTADGTIEERPYWELPNAPARTDVSPADAVAMVHDGLRDAVRAASVADVPVGAYLSGGLDSSLIVALMAKERDGQGIETFSANFAGDTLDELPFARQVSSLLGTNHHEVTVTPEDFRANWPALTRNFDAPIPEPPDIAFSSLAHLAREEVKVVLSGEGSDELFAGYPKYRYAQLVERFSALPPSARRATFGRLQTLLPARLNRPRTVARALAAPSEDEQFRTWFAPFTAPERMELVGGLGRGEYTRVWAQAHGDVIQRMQYVDMHAWLVDNILERGDRTAMSASLELRPPFLDHELVELALSLPSNVKVRDGATKWVVREVAKQYLPDEIFTRAKHGFKVPLDSWFRGDLRPWARDLLTGRDSFVGQMMDRTAVDRLLTNHERGRRNDGMRIYTLVGLEVWHREYFTNAATVVG
ncbi:MAG: asparagine synthase (glutamine-hydrolyzing) [Acidimicrobiia bacterium]